MEESSRSGAQSRPRTLVLEMIAVIDETSPEGNGGVYYVVTAAILMNHPDAATRTLVNVIGNRTRPFHWAQEGSQSRNRMLDALCELEVLATPWIHYPTGRKQQESVRQKLWPKRSCNSSWMESLR